MKFLHHSAACLVLAAAATSCASHEPKKDSLDTQGRLDRSMRASTKAAQAEYMRGSTATTSKSKTHSFDKSFNTAAAGDRGAMKLLGSKTYHSSDYSGLKSFSGTKDYHTNEFSQSGKKSRWGSQTSRYETQANSMSGKTFSTKKSQFDGQAAHDSSKSFHGSSQTFKTGDFQPAAKSIEDNKRPMIEQAKPGEAARNANAYSEDEVRKLLGR
jgi:hypothetical protein